MKLFILAVCALVAGTQAVNLVEKAQQLGLTTLVKLLDDAGLKDTIATGGPFTIFAPSNEAFESLPKHITDYLMKNKTALAEVLKYHVVKGDVMSKDLTNEQLAPSLQGEEIRVNIYKQMKGSVITASGRRVVKADETASNGVIHVIDRVMLPPPGTIVDLVKMVPDFSTLLKAVSIAGLGGDLSGKGPFTLFAPTNAAFEKIPKEDLDALLGDKEKLTAVLKYHVVSGTVYAAGLHPEMMVPTLEGHNITITMDHMGVHINKDSRVIHPDMTVTNGVVHVIDTVLMPPMHHYWSEEAKKIFKDPQIFFN